MNTLVDPTVSDMDRNEQNIGNSPVIERVPTQEPEIYIDQSVPEVQKEEPVVNPTMVVGMNTNPIVEAAQQYPDSSLVPPEHLKASVPVELNDYRTETGKKSGGNISAGFSLN